MTLRPCRCGLTPTLAESVKRDVQIMCIICPCGNHGAALLYIKPEDRTKMAQAAWDGWNLAAT